MAAYREYIRKSGGVLLKYIPEGIKGEPVRVVMLPDDVHTVGAGCLAPEGTSIPEKVAYDWDTVFPVELVMIPDNIKTIRPAAFMGCMTVKQFLVMPGCDACYVSDDILYSGDGKCVICCPPCLEGERTIENVDVIEENAFEGSYLSRVIIPEGVSEIKDDNFSYSFDLERVDVPASVKKIGERCFIECESLTVYAPLGSVAHTYCETHGIPYKER